LLSRDCPNHQRARFAEEWRGHVDEIQGDLNKLDAAIGFLRAARRMTRIGKEVTGQDAPILSRVVEAAAFVALVLLPISPLLPAFFGQHYNLLSIGCIIWTYGGLFLISRNLYPVTSTTLYTPLSTTDETGTRSQQTTVSSELILRERKLDDALRRLVDIEYSLASFLFVLPLFLFTAFAIRLESAGPAFDYQPRIGLGRRRFMLVKFRSTRADDGISHGATPDGCPRLTRIGAIIRKLRLDELPQLINVLRDEMSLVGPCPAPPSVAAELQRAQPLFADRVLVKPGIIGWAQINRRCDCTSMNDAWLNLSYDLYYLKHRSWLLDLLILFRTPLAVIFSANA
jgi:lipopolysaccharide/colanic/teichoic acid biosynthesis glycosyltransferase